MKRTRNSRHLGVGSVIYVLAQSIAVYLLLILGWGSVRDAFAHPARVGTMVAMALGSLTVLGLGIKVPTDARKLRSEVARLISLAILGALYFWLLPLSDRMGWFVILPDQQVRYTGLLVFGIGTGLRTWAFLARQEMLSLDGLTSELDSPKLIETGIYQRIRHPQYLGIWLQALGFALVCRSWLGFAVSLVLIVPLHERMDAEDAYLRDIFGKRHEAWAQRSWRMFPGIY